MSDHIVTVRAQRLPNTSHATADLVLTLHDDEVEVKIKYMNRTLQREHSVCFTEDFEELVSKFTSWGDYQNQYAYDNTAAMCMLKKKHNRLKLRIRYRNGSDTTAVYLTEDQHLTVMDALVAASARIRV